MILHELCHLIHQQILGLDCEHVKALYMRAQQSGRYNRVLRRDWAGKENGDTDLSYSMIDHKEFFAEMSVTYWSKGYNEFDQASGDNMNECTPLITDPTVLTRPGYKPGFNKAEGELLSGGAALLWVGSFMKYILPQKRHLLHCNKFYPFTSGQLRHYDPTLYLDMKNIWNDISMWEDPTYNHAYCSGCWIQPWVNKNGKRGLFEETVDVAGPLIVISDTVEL